MWCSFPIAFPSPAPASENSSSRVAGTYAGGRGARKSAISGRTLYSTLTAHGLMRWASGQLASRPCWRPLQNQRLRQKLISWEDYPVDTRSAPGRKIGGMDKHKAHARVGVAAIFLGVSDWGIELLDAFGRWETLMTFPNIPFVHFLLSPLVSPGLIFIGMLLILGARERQHKAEIEDDTTQHVVLHGADDRPLPTVSRGFQWWKWGLLVLSSALFAVLIVGVRIWFYLPDAPSAPSPPGVVLVEYPTNRPINNDHPTAIGPNCPNGICPTGPNFGNQTVINGPPPVKLTVASIVSGESAK